ncbi:MAG: acetyl-CoA carboxylase carboxyl transferase subunit alpha/beta [Desulfovibrionaceae bacterium]
MDLDKLLAELGERLAYIGDIFGSREGVNYRMLAAKLSEFTQAAPGLDEAERRARLAQLGDLFDFLERKLDDDLEPMDRVRIVRHPQRICLSDILENVYDNYTEIGGQDEFSLDPAVCIARAYVSRRRGDKVVHQPVMVIGHEKGHGEEFRNGGSAKPWGNAKALQAMQVAESENIPVHAYIFTPGAYPVEDYPGAAQQIARNLYEMAALSVPVVSVISEGGSGGAEAMGLADRRLMLSHGYYSVISPEGAAAIEEGLRTGQRASADTVRRCARQLRITAADNLALGFVDAVVPEPPLGARPYHLDFFKRLRHAVIRATDQVVSEVRGLYQLRRLLAGRETAQAEAGGGPEPYVMSWNLGAAARERLVDRRQAKYRAMARHAFLDRRSWPRRTFQWAAGTAWAMHSLLRYDVVGKHKRRLERGVEEFVVEARALVRRLTGPLRRLFASPPGPALRGSADLERLTRLSCPEEGTCLTGDPWPYPGGLSGEDRVVTCPNAASHGCRDIWAPDLYTDFAGVCPNCGHHFRMEYQWYLYNIFGYARAREVDRDIEAGDPLGFEGFNLKLEQAKTATSLTSACLTFETEIAGVRCVVAALVAPFRGGSVGAAEGEKFIRAAERARRKHWPLIAFVHGTAGIRIQEGVCGVIQMPRCTMAVRRYIDAGGLYLVLYDTNSYAGPVASFLGCAPYQFAMRSSNLGFAGPMVILETTGELPPPKYHSAWQALARGHIQGVWDRRDLPRNLQQALLTMGGRNLYYR